jgi:hypothetical protein
MRFLPVLICCLLIPNLFPQEVPQSAPSSPLVPVVEREEKQFNFYPGGKIEISTATTGSVKIIGWQKATVRVEAEKIIYYPSQEQPAPQSSQQPKDQQAPAKPQAPFRVRFTQTSAVIRTSVSPGVNMEINLTVYVPGDRTDVTAKISKGDFSIEGVNGWTEVTVATEGGIDAKSVSGYFSGTTPRGDINVEMSDIRWRGLEFGALTQYGSINLLLPVKYSAALQLETRNGKILVDFPPQVVEGEETPPDILIHKTAQSLKATVGDGGAPVKLATYFGDVKLSKKE